jgi:hypothetical protein
MTGKKITSGDNMTRRNQWEIDYNARGCKGRTFDEIQATINVNNDECGIGDFIGASIDICFDDISKHANASGINKIITMDPGAIASFDMDIGNDDENALKQCGIDITSKQSIVKAFRNGDLEIVAITR